MQNILALAEHAADEGTRTALNKMAEDGFADITAKRVSILDLLEKYPAIEIDTGTFLSMLPPMRVRQ